ncbi:uncharacterized protein LOC101849775 [Aplysia californica]|uniref:Uncharacterized protein LOC101849775 n=1 Tax=Aplysia californica TaxID=6500 RepID=A0ABM1VV25_APLCA|nr:uncharacterized protein LOC101849775 [Aplysia californica]XP_012939349.1 uncharacterized protein LOC101849775 [Aplysia californica]XP_035826267.1 uncharacterized protein LOC101849775 [Aplysia californica]
MAPTQKKPVEVVVFDNPEKKRKQRSGDVPPQGMGRKATDKYHKDGPSASREPKVRVFDQRSAKHEIRKLGIYGFDKKKKDDAMVDLLVELGAKRPKGKRYHIQEYQKILKQKKEEEKEREEMERRAGIKKKKEKVKRKRDKDDLLNFVDGQAGFFKDGVQFVKSLRK